LKPYYCLYVAVRPHLLLALKGVDLLSNSTKFQHV
jgi:hypothetical protein